MTRFRCARCDWQSENDGDVFAHTQPADQGGAGHPRCVLCRLSLTPTEQQSCGKCLGRVRADLRDIGDWYALLPATLGHLGSNAPRRDARSHGDGSERLPGGDALVMLAGGSEGLLWAGRPPPVDNPDLDEYTAVYACKTCGQGGILDRAKHLLDGHKSTAWTTFPQVYDVTGWVPLWPVTNDNLPTIAPSVVFELCRIEDAWREAQHQPPARGRRTVIGVVDYLSGKPCEWAARWHDPDAWRGDVEEIRDLRRWLAPFDPTSTPVETGVPCFDCRTPLIREYRDRQRIPICLGHNWDVHGKGGSCPIPFRPGCCDKGGRVDDWSCPRCGRVYPPDSDAYRLALRAALAS